MYESFFGLTGNPFRLSPDPAFLFESKGHGKAHTHLRCGIAEGEGFVVMTGEIGAGKTTLIQAVMQELDPERMIAAHLVTAQLEADQLLRALAIAFGLKLGTVRKAQLLDAIRAFLISLASQNRRALLIVDEAQNLAPSALEELCSLSNVQDDNRAVLQTFLIGQPGLREMMRSASMRKFCQRVIATCHLGPIDCDETSAYIEHRLRIVHWKSNPSFDPAALAVIYQATGGIPRRINALCNRMMLSAYIHRQHRITVQHVVQARDELQNVLSPFDRDAQASLS